MPPTSNSNPCILFEVNVYFQLFYSNSCRFAEVTARIADTRFPKTSAVVFALFTTVLPPTRPPTSNKLLRMRQQLVQYDVRRSTKTVSKTYLYVCVIEYRFQIR